MVRILAIFGVIVVSFLILITSVFRSAGVRYSFHHEPTPTPSSSDEINIDYELPYPGRVGPTNVLWPLKVMRDKLWLWMNTNDLKKAEIALLFSDKRLSSALDLMNKGDTDNGVLVMGKGEVYLNEALSYARKARDQGMDVIPFVQVLGKSTLKHRGVMEEMLVVVPEDAKPVVAKMVDVSKKVYEESMHLLHEEGIDIMPNPFEKS